MYYVYVHTRLKDDSIFYVGKGKGDRLNTKTQRNDYWNNIVKKDGGFVAKVVKDNLTNEEACELEKKMITEIGLDNLANLAEGGSGGDTRKGFTTEQYQDWLNKKSKAQSKNVGYWKNKERKEHADTIKEKHKNGNYSYEWLKRTRSEEARKNMSEAAKNKVLPKIKCEKCGREIVSTHFWKHVIGTKCK